MIKTTFGKSCAKEPKVVLYFGSTFSKGGKGCIVNLNKSFLLLIFA